MRRLSPDSINQRRANAAPAPLAHHNPSTMNARFRYRATTQNTAPPGRPKAARPRADRPVCHRQTRPAPSDNRSPRSALRRAAHSGVILSSTRSTKRSPYRGRERATVCPSPQYRDTMAARARHASTDLKHHHAPLSGRAEAAPPLREICLTCADPQAYWIGKRIRVSEKSTATPSCSAIRKRRSRSPARPDHRPHATGRRHRRVRAVSLCAVLKLTGSRSRALPPCDACQACDGSAGRSNYRRAPLPSIGPLRCGNQAPRGCRERALVRNFIAQNNRAKPPQTVPDRRLRSAIRVICGEPFEQMGQQWRLVAASAPYRPPIRRPSPACGACGGGPPRGRARRSAADCAPVGDFLGLNHLDPCTLRGSPSHASSPTTPELR